jgi:N-methylhydantoinase A
VALAEAVSAKDVLVPLAPGITAAMGLLSTDIQYEHTRSVITPLFKATQADLDRVNRVVGMLTGLGNDDLAGDGIAPEHRQFEVIAECRYHGQGFELRAAMPAGGLTLANKQGLIDDFHGQHKTDYGYAFDDSLVELYNVRVIARAAVNHLKLAKLPPGTQDQLQASYLYSRDTVFDDASRHETPRYDRTRLGAGVEISGPAILIQHNSTTLVPPGYAARVLDHGALRVVRV